jgi:outer membrane lipoprotein SlyB
MKKLILISAIAAASVLAGCASSTSGSVYNRSQTRGEMMVREGTVESVRPVKIEGTKSPVGVVAGAMVGSAVGGNTGGHDRYGGGSFVGSVVGTVIGGIAGAAIEEKVTETNGVEITVRLDNGSLTAVTQEADEVFRPGERVRLLSGRGTTRVSH